jgi:hypothetical protein
MKTARNATVARTKNSEGTKDSERTPPIEYNLF